MKTKQETDGFLIQHYCRCRQPSCLGNGASWLRGSVLLCLTGFWTLRVTAACLESLQHSVPVTLRSRVLLCHLCNGDMNHLLCCMSKSSASKPAVVPTVTALSTAAALSID